MRDKGGRKVAGGCAALLILVSLAAAQSRPIDTTKSTVTVEVKKAGLLSAFGHDHEITASLAGGFVDAASHTAELRWNATALRVADPGISEKDRMQIQSTMLGPEVLDSGRYAEILFRATRAEMGGAGIWKVSGDLTLHGQTRPVTAEVRESGGHYSGMVRLRQTDFGIKPVKVAGGTVRVKDEVEIVLEVELAR